MMLGYTGFATTLKLGTEEKTSTLGTVRTLPSSCPEQSHSDQNDHRMSLSDVFIFVLRLLSLIAQ